jgi:hypothetical protein
MLGCGACADGGGNCGRDCAGIIAGNTSNPAAHLAANPIRLVYCIPAPELRCPAIALVSSSAFSRSILLNSANHGPNLELDSPSFQYMSAMTILLLALFAVAANRACGRRKPNTTLAPSAPHVLSGVLHLKWARLAFDKRTAVLANDRARQQEKRGTDLKDGIGVIQTL